MAAVAEVESHPGRGQEGSGPEVDCPSPETQGERVASTAGFSPDSAPAVDHPSRVLHREGPHSHHPLRIPLDWQTLRNRYRSGLRQVSDRIVRRREEENDSRNGEVPKVSHERPM